VPFRKFAKSDVLEVRTSATRQEGLTGEGFSRLAAVDPSSYSPDGYLYVRTRAISSRVNKNNDGWPSAELEKSYGTFEGRPVFVDHNNDDPERTRGVVAWSKLHVEDGKEAALDPYYASAPQEHLPPTWIELMIEVDAQEFPKLAEKIVKKEIDAVSMGADIEVSKCSVCGHEATNPSQYCSHVQKKGAEFEVTSDTGEKIHKRAYEDCHGITFFEISFVFDPADETALLSETSPRLSGALAELAAYEEKGEEPPAELIARIAGIETEAAPAAGYPEEEGAQGGWQEGDELTPPTAPGQEEIPESGEDEYEGQPEGRDERPQMYEWRYKQLTEMGFDPQLADLLARAVGHGTELGKSYDHYFDIHQLRDLIGAGATPEQAMDISASTKEAVPNDRGKDNLGLHTAPSPTRERAVNHEPQADKTRAPDQVDTLRQDYECKRCGSDMETESDGRVICPECGFEQEPEHFDNPDLELAREVDLRQDSQGQENEQGELETELEHDKGETDIEPEAQERTSPIRPVAPISSASAPVTGDMELVEIAPDDEAAEKLAALENGKQPATTGKPAAKKNERIVSDQLKPVTSAEEEEPVEGEGTEHTADRETIKRTEEDDSGVRRTEEITKEYGPTPGQQPEGEAEEQAEEPKAEEEKSEGEGEKSESEEAPEPTAEGEEAEGAPGSGSTTDAEEKVPAMAAAAAEPEEPEVSEKDRLMKALEVSKEAVGMGVVGADEELAYAAELEELTPEAVEAVQETLSRVAKAGLTKTKRRVIAAGRFPSMAGVGANGSANGAIGELGDDDASDLFLGD
jgi:hypothetical protein